MQIFCEISQYHWMFSCELQEVCCSSQSWMTALIDEFWTMDRADIEDCKDQVAPVFGFQAK